jgi:hypothetical protein
MATGSLAHRAPEATTADSSSRVQRLVEGASLPALVRVTLAIGIGHLALRCAIAAWFPMFYTEAYYREWSRFLDWGYLDQPPMIAWLVRLVEELWPVSFLPAPQRTASLAIGTATILLIYRLAWTMFDDRAAACRAVIVGICMPILVPLGFMVLPESPLVCFHLAALIFFAKAVRGGGPMIWCAAGAAAGLALLCKLDALLAIVGAAGYLLSSAEHRRWLRRREPYLALLTALLIFAPYLYWNASHEWAGLSLQLLKRFHGRFGFRLSRMLEFAGEQIPNGFLLLTPIVLFLFTPGAAVPPDRRAMFGMLKWQSLAVLTGVLALASVSGSHPNWTALAYPPAAVAIAMLWTIRPRDRLARFMKWAVPASLAAMVVTAVIGIVGLHVVLRADTEAIGGSFGRGLAKGRIRLLDWGEARCQAERVLAEQFPKGDGELFCGRCDLASLMSASDDCQPVVLLFAHVGPPRRVEQAQRYYFPRSAWRGDQGIFVSIDKRADDFLLKRFAEVTELAPIQPSQERWPLPKLRVFRVAQLKPCAETTGRPAIQTTSIASP